jgi:hypothetical protein
MRIEVDGSGFGQAAIGLPYKGDVQNFEFRDTSRSEAWGYGGDYGLQYTSWSDTQIVVNGFTRYGNGAIVVAGDQVSVSVTNIAGGQPTVWTGTLVASPGPPLVTGQPNPVVTSVTFSNIGQSSHIVVTGVGFGQATIAMPYTGDVPNFEFVDTSRNENWGYSGDYGLSYTSWSDTQIVVDGFATYGNGAIVVAGDLFDVWVKNQSSTEFYNYNGTLSSSASPTPTPAPAPSATPGPQPGPVIIVKALTLFAQSEAPGGQQIARVVTKPGSSVVLVIDYPNGKQKVLGPDPSARNGRLAFPWKVPTTIHGKVHVTMVSAGMVAQATFTVT